MKESLLKFSLTKLLDGYRMAKRLDYIRVNSGMLKGGAYTNRFGVTKDRLIKLARAGTPDIIIFFPNGKTVFMELKSDTGTQTDAQKEYQANIERLGFNYYLIFSIEQAMTVISSIVNI